MLVGRRYLLAFTPEQEAYAFRTAAACRAAWNVGLEQRREYRRRDTYINYVEQARQMTEAKRENPWFAEAPHQCLQSALHELDRACRTHGTFRVRWRSKARTAPYFRFTNRNLLPVRRLSRRWGEVRLSNFGWVRFRWSRPLGGSIRYATVKRDGERWYISFCVEDGVVEVAPNGKPPVGVDRGIRVAVATSDGRTFGRLFATPNETQRLRRLSKQLSRQRTKRSNRRDETKAKLRRLNARIRNRRSDFAVQTAINLVRNHGLIVIEDLKVANMTRTAKGTVEKPGRLVAQKSGLNKAILDKGWYPLTVWLQHTARYHGSQIVKVPAAYTSQTCHACKHIASESRESQAVFRCVACGHQDNADVNAAKNILERGIELVSAAGLAVAGRGDLDTGRSAKRQPPVLTAA